MEPGAACELDITTRTLARWLGSRIVSVAEEAALSLTLLTVVGPLAVSRSIKTRLPVKGRLPLTATEKVPRVAVRLTSDSLIRGRTFTSTIWLVTASQRAR